jgi:hypothetical protein
MMDIVTVGWKSKRYITPESLSEWRIGSPTLLIVCVGYRGYEMIYISTPTLCCNISAPGGAVKDVVLTWPISMFLTANSHQPAFPPFHGDYIKERDP